MLLSGNFQTEHFKKRHYRNINSLSLYRPVLVSDNVQSEQVTTVEMVPRTIISERKQFKPL